MIIDGKLNPTFGQSRKFYNKKHAATIAEVRTEQIKTFSKK